MRGQGDKGTRRQGDKGTGGRGGGARRWAALVLFVLLVAAGLRLYRLPGLPLGLHYDEAANGILAGEIARGIEAPVFISSYTGKEVLFFYWAALWMRLVGVTLLALRLSAASVGLATVAASVWAVGELLHGRRDGRWVALLTGGFLATSFWHVVLSRYGFRAVTQPLLQALTVASLWRGLRLASPVSSSNSSSAVARGWVWLFLGGVLCGLTGYTYLAARAFPAPLAAAMLVLLAVEGGRRRVRLGQLALFVSAAALTLSPLAHYWLSHPGSFLTRAEQVAATSWAEVWAGVRACLGMFFLRGDPYVRFNLPHRPIFDPPTAILFFLGVVILVWGGGRRVSGDAHLSLAARVFLLVCLPVMLLPSALAVGEITPSNLRAVGLLPFVYVFPALGLSFLGARVSRRPALGVGYAVFVVLFVVFLACVTGMVYFGEWASSAALYYAADGDLADVAGYLNGVDLAGVTPYVASVHYRHPTLAFLAEDYEAIRWLTGGSTVVFPAEGEGLLVFPRSAAGELAWVGSLLAEDGLPVVASSPDGSPAFYVYRVGSVSGSTPTRPLTANLGQAALVVGYDVVGEGAPRSGEEVEVAVWWRVLGVPEAGDYGPLVRLVDGWGFVWGEARPFHYPSEQWTVGEWVVDRLSIPVAAGAPPGDYTARFGLYSASADSVLPVLDEAGRYAGTGVGLPLRLARAVSPPDEGDLDIRDRMDVRAGEVTLLGVNLDTVSARPGERLYVTLFWRAEEFPLSDREVVLALGDVVVYDGAPVHGTYPMSEWTAGEVVVDRYDARLPRDAPAGDYVLRLGLYDPATGSEEGAMFDLGVVTVRAVERVFDVPPVSHPLTVTLGGQVELLGYDLATSAVPRSTYEGEAVVAPGEALRLVLYWRALTEMDEDYTVFVHLLGADGGMVGQRDGQPVGGGYPTSLWMAGEVVADVYEVTVRRGAAPGGHRLEVGMYVAETGERLAVAGSADDSVVLGRVFVVGP